jgi:hypothetical protein
MIQEKWKCIPGYSKYIASNTGKIMRVPQLAPNTSNNVSGKTNGRCGLVLSPRPLPTQGHLQVGIINDNGKKIMEYVHRLVALAWIKKRPGKELVLHKDDNPNNNSVSNLKWGTHYMNSQMITVRNTAKTRGKYMDSMERVVKLYYTNKGSYSGKAKDLVKEIAKDLGISIAYVYSLIYHPKSKQFRK